MGHFIELKLPTLLSSTECIALGLWEDIGGRCERSTGANPANPGETMVYDRRVDGRVRELMPKIRGLQNYLATVSGSE
jgi:hypothetical protein